MNKYTKNFVAIFCVLFLNSTTIPLASAMECTNMQLVESYRCFLGSPNEYTASGKVEIRVDDRFNPTQWCQMSPTKMGSARIMPISKLISFDISDDLSEGFLLSRENPANSKFCLTIGDQEGGSACSWWDAQCLRD